MAFPNDMSRTVEAIAGSTASITAFTNDSRKPARNLIRKQYVFAKVAADGAAATASPYSGSPGMRMKQAGRILGVSVASNGALTVDAANNAVISAVSADGLGGAAVVGASLTTDVASGFGSWVAGSTKGPGAAAANPANTRYAAGQWLGFAITKNGTGVVVPASTIVVDVEEEDIDGYSV